MDSAPYSAGSVPLRAQQHAGSLDGLLHRAPLGRYPPQSSGHLSPVSSVTLNLPKPLPSPPQVPRRILSVTRCPSPTGLERPPPFTQEQLSFLEEMQMATVLKCKRMQDAVIDKVCECVQECLISCDEQLKALSTGTQALSAPLNRQLHDLAIACELDVGSTLKGFTNQGTHASTAISLSEFLGGEQKTQQPLVDSDATAIKTLRSQIGLDEERSEIPILNMSRHLEDLHNGATRVDSVCRENSGLAVHIAAPWVVENCRSKEMVIEAGTSRLPQSCEEVLGEERASFSQQDATESIANDEPFYDQTQDGFADLLTKLQALEQHVKHAVTVKPPCCRQAPTQGILN